MYPAVLLKDLIYVVYHEGRLPQWFVASFLPPVILRRNTRIPAALVMYQRARKLATLAAEPSNFVPMAELQMEAYLGAVNALSLVDQRAAWIAIPLTAESDSFVCPLLLPQLFQANGVPPAPEKKEVIETYPGGTIRSREKGHGSR